MSPKCQRTRTWRDPPVFPQFVRLPLEIQEMIWRFSIDGAAPRVVEVTEGPRIKTRRGSYLRETQFRSACPIPGVLHANRHSRNLALRRWKLSFASSDRLASNLPWRRTQHPTHGPSVKDDQPARIFFDFSTDILYFGPSFREFSEFTERVCLEERQRITQVAFHLQQQLDYLQGFSGAEVSSLLFREFPNLTHVIRPAMDYDVDFDCTKNCLPQPEPDPKKTVICFYQTDQTAVEWEDYELDTLAELVEHRVLKGLQRIRWISADHRRTVPGESEEDERKWFRMKQQALTEWRQKNGLPKFTG